MKKLIPILILILSCLAAAVYQPHRRTAFRPSVVSGAWTPTNSLAWYYADSIVQSDGYLIGQWNDSSGHNYHLYKFLDTDSYRPYLTNNVLNGHSLVAYFGGNKALTNSYGSTKSQPITMFAVFSWSGSIVDRFLWDGISANPREIVQQNVTTGTIGIYAGTAFQNSPSAAPAGFNVYTVYYNAASSYVRTNGVNWYTVASTIGTQGQNGITLGLRYTSDTFDFTGWVAELIIYEGTMADGDRNWVESNLKTKYGL